MKYYSGIGSRETPQHIIANMIELAETFSKNDYILRSGGASGADAAFEQGATNAQCKSEIYLPWKQFNNNSSPLHPPSQKALKIAEQFHPRWTMLEKSVRLLMARNVHQVLGPNCDEPVECVVCYTPDGCENGEQTTKNTGGTGQALRIATFFKIPIYNLARRDIGTIKLLLNLGD